MARQAQKAILSATMNIVVRRVMAKAILWPCRLIRKADGSLISATFVYPEALADQYKVIGGNALASLKITEAAEKVEAAAPAAAKTR